MMIGFVFFCVETLQETTADPSLREHTAWPAQPQDAYGLEVWCLEFCCRTHTCY
jgi:hypothetical protein